MSCGQVRIDPDIRRQGSRCPVRGSLKSWISCPASSTRRQKSINVLAPYRGDWDSAASGVQAVKQAEGGGGRGQRIEGRLDPLAIAPALDAAGSRPAACPSPDESRPSGPARNGASMSWLSSQNLTSTVASTQALADSLIARESVVDLPPVTRTQVGLDGCRCSRGTSAGPCRRSLASPRAGEAGCFA